VPASILVIEDDPASLELLKYLLGRAGYEVYAAPDGAAGLQAALRHNPDLVLCDLQMPALTGFEVLARLRADAHWRVAPVVAVTAYSMPGDCEAALAAGFSDYLTKPIDPDTFLDEVARFLKQSGSGSGHA
jgi:two-component system cell cycle response regulator DivK